MKKFLVLTLALLVVGFGVNAMAYDGDFELSGHINTGFGWQYNGKKVTSALGGAFTNEGMIPNDATPNRFGFGVTTPAGAFANNTNNSTWLFYMGDVELDITKTFGENIRLRTDLDFFRANSNSFGALSWANAIEQAYVTINIPVGYGVEFLVGRFNAPMGFEAVDNNDNDLPFHTIIYSRLRPQNLTGIKFYYAFSDLVDLHLYLANNLRDVMGGGLNADGSLPAFGLRLGFTWGMEGQESTFGIGGVFSPEAGQVGNKWDDWSYVADIDFNVWVNDVFAIGGEGIFRRDGALNGLKDNYYYGGLLNLHYVFSDVWDGTLRYAYAHDVSGGAWDLGPARGGAATVTGFAAQGQYKTYGAGISALAADAQFHEIDLGINYHITDGAKLMTMYRFDMIIPDKAGLAKSIANGNQMGVAHTIAANFAYEF